MDSSINQPWLATGTASSYRISKGIAFLETSNRHEKEEAATLRNIFIHPEIQKIRKTNLRSLTSSTLSTRQHPGRRSREMLATIDSHRQAAWQDTKENNSPIMLFLRTIY
jgi:hypothetical protein